MLVCSCILGLAAIAHCRVFGDEPFPVLAWYSIPEPNLNDERFEELARAGFNHSLMRYSPEASQRALDLAHRHGIKLFIVDHRIASSDPSTAIEAVDLYRDHPALAGYSLRDEPPAGEFAEHARVRDFLAKADPMHWAYVNLLPTYASTNQLGTETYIGHLRQFLQQFRPKVLSYDHYPVLEGNRIREDFYQNLEWVRDACIEHDTPFWGFALSCAHSPYPIAEPGHLRFQVWSQIAYGAAGIQYFTYWTPKPGKWDFHEAPIRLDGTRSEVYERVRRLNLDLQTCADILTDGRVTEVVHSGPLPDGTTAVHEGSPFLPHPDSVQSPWLCSLRTTREGHLYATVVNRSPFEPADISLVYSPWVSHAQPAHDLWGVKKCQSDNSGVRISLEAGAAAIFRIHRKSVRQPVMRGSLNTELAPHGQGNIYAPDIHIVDDTLRMYYGGQGRDGHDRIHMATSTDGTRWEKHGVVLDNGDANHVNDPSVVRAANRWWMFYTIASEAEMDRIAAASSPDGLVWTGHGVVMEPSSQGSWDSLKVGRPAVLYSNNKFRMWYDGQPDMKAGNPDETARLVARGGRAVGYAESQDGLRWTRHPNPVLHHGAGAVDVEFIGDSLILVMEGRDAIRWTASTDGLTWGPLNMLVKADSGPADRHGMVTPHLFYHGGSWQLASGLASRTSWDGNAISFEAVDFPARFLKNPD